MEKGSADKMACKACVNKCGDQCPWCRTVLYKSLPPVASRGLQYLVPVKYRRIRGCTSCASCGCDDIASIGLCAVVFAVLAYGAYMSLCTLDCSWACHTQASLAATYAAASIALIMHPWGDTPMGVLGTFHALVGSLFLVLCLVGCSEFAAFLLMIVLFPVCLLCSLRLNSHWQ